MVEKNGPLIPDPKKAVPAFQQAYKNMDSFKWKTKADLNIMEAIQIIILYGQEIIRLDEEK